MLAVCYLCDVLSLQLLLSKLSGLEESHEVLQSELSTAHSDLATVTSQSNTHCLETEKARPSSRTLPPFLPLSLSLSLSLSTSLLSPTSLSLTLLL